MDSQTAAPLWPLSKPKLAELATIAGGGSNAALVEGQNARDIYSEFVGSVTKFYSEDGKAYAVSIRPLMPTVSGRTLTCSPDMIKSETTQPTTSTPTK